MRQRSFFNSCNRGQTVDRYLMTSLNGQRPSSTYSQPENGLLPDLPGPRPHRDKADFLDECVFKWTVFTPFVPNWTLLARVVQMRAFWVSGHHYDVIICTTLGPSKHPIQTKFGKILFCGTNLSFGATQLSMCTEMAHTTLLKLKMEFSHFLPLQHKRDDVE